MIVLTCDTPMCEHIQKLTDLDYANGKFSLNCPRCGATLWLNETDNRCLRCDQPTRDVFCADCTFEQVAQITPYGGRTNPIVETEFDYQVRH